MEAIYSCHTKQGQWPQTSASGVIETFVCAIEAASSVQRRPPVPVGQIFRLMIMLRSLRRRVFKSISRAYVCQADRQMNKMKQGTYLPFHWT